MTEATPLASEQITQALEALKPFAAIPLDGDNTPDGYPDPRVWQKHLVAARAAVAALSASPAPSGQGVSGEVERAQEALGEACALIQEAKGFAGPGDITDHLDFAESWLNKIDLAALAARSCAPGGVAIWTEEPTDAVLEALRSVRDTGVSLHNVYTTMRAAALSPQGLDAKESGE